MRSQYEVCRCRLRAVAMLLGAVVLLCSAGAASAKEPSSSQAGFDAFLQAWSSAETATPPATTEEAPAGPGTAETPPATQPEEAVSETPEADAQAAPPADPGGSLLSRAAPILLGLLGVAIVLLGLAALPPARRRASTLSVLVAERRIEIGLIGGAALASAAIGLVVAAAAG
jgi:hypothetical protein